MNIHSAEEKAQQNAIKDELSNNLETNQAQEIQRAKKKQLLKMKNKKRNRCTCSTTSSNSIRNIKQFGRRIHRTEIQEAKKISLKMKNKTDALACTTPRIINQNIK